MQDFHSGLEGAYLALEGLLNSFRKQYKEDFGTFGTPITVPKDWVPNRENDHQRVCLCLDNGYAAKVLVFGREKFYYSVSNPFMSQFQAHQEEINAETLRFFGFTKENGFYVPDHKVVGWQLNSGIVKINPKGIGIAITEDLTENGMYQVTDIRPLDFYLLSNREEFAAEYHRHLEGLLDLYRNPCVFATINRHGRPDNPIEPISRMLLKRVKDGKGEIVIGDLDNIMFE